MRTLLTMCVVAFTGTPLVADPPAKKVEPPYAILEFSNDRKLEKWSTTFEMTTASGATYELAVDFGDRGNIHDEKALQLLLAANWVVEPITHNSVRISGVRTKEGTTDTVKTLSITNKPHGMGQMPTLTASGEVKVDAKIDDGKAEPDPKRKVPPKGPTLPNETFVEFDLSKLPLGTDGVRWEIMCEVQTTAGKKRPRIQVTFDVESVGATENVIDSVAGYTFPEYGFKAEVVGKTKFRVYGGVSEGKYYPAIEGKVTSPHLKPEQLPKITNPVRG